MKQVITIQLVAILLLSVVAQADVLEFASGDRLTGKVVSLAEGMLVFESADAGKVSIDLARIKTFATDEPAEVHLRDGTVVKSTIVPAEAGKFAVHKTDVLPAQTFALTDLVAINPPPKPPVVWHGNIAAGWTLTSGNTSNENASISAEVMRRSKQDRIRANSLYLVSRQRDPDTGDKKTTQESFAIGGQYDYFLTEKLYAFGNGSFKKDHIADLDRRIIAGLGMGYQWIETDKMNFTTDAGVAEVCEKYTHGDSVEKSDEFSGQLGYHFDWVLNDTLTFVHNLRYYPSFGKLSDYFLTTDAEIRAKLTESLFASFKAIFDYDSTPGPDVGSTDTKYIASIGWIF